VCGCLECVWSVSGVCLECVWSVSGERRAHAAATAPQPVAAAAAHLAGAPLQRAQLRGQLLLRVARLQVLEHVGVLAPHALRIRRLGAVFGQRGVQRLQLLCRRVGEEGGVGVRGWWGWCGRGGVRGTGQGGTAGGRPFTQSALTQSLSAPARAAQADRWLRPSQSSAAAALPWRFRRPPTWAAWSRRLLRLSTAAVTRASSAVRPPAR
jgi:hypothetical protein